MKPGSSSSEYRAKAAHETSKISRRKKELGHPPPSGDPASGLMILVEPPSGPRVSEALQRSLETLDLSDAYVTYPSLETLLEEILSAQPSALVALGPKAAREIDNLAYPLAHSSFSDATEGAWFTWTKGTAGLLLPSLAPALHDENAKRRFWHAFLSLRSLTRP